MSASRASIAAVIQSVLAHCDGLALDDPHDRDTLAKKLTQALYKDIEILPGTFHRRVHDLLLEAFNDDGELDESSYEALAHILALARSTTNLREGRSASDSLRRHVAKRHPEVAPKAKR